MEKKLIVNADDYGYTPGVTHGILEAYINGIVTSTTTLTVSNYFKQATALASAIAPDLAIGVHLTLTLRYGTPILPISDVPSLVDQDGYFWDQHIFLEKINIDEVYKEWDAQIAKFYETGQAPDHLDSHHNVHGKSESLLDVALELAKKYNLPLRNASRSIDTEHYINLYQKKGISTPDKMMHTFYAENATYKALSKIIRKIITSDLNIFEMNVHPAFIDEEIQKYSNYQLGRIKELAILTSDKTKEMINDSEIILANYELFSE